MLINNLMKEYGDMSVAGLGVAMKVNMVAVMLLMGLWHRHPAASWLQLLEQETGKDTKVSFVFLLSLLCASAWL